MTYHHRPPFFSHSSGDNFHHNQQSVKSPSQAETPTNTTEQHHSYLNPSNPSTVSNDQDHNSPSTPSTPRPGSLGHFAIADPSQLYHVNSVNNQAPSHPHLLNLHRGQQSSLGLMDSFGFPHQPPFNPIGSSNVMNQDRSIHSIHPPTRSASGGSPQGFKCPNCPKVFARDDLLRRHLAREARAQAQPVVDRQKSCYECARSKARCDLEVPSCGRCKTRGKSCVYGARSGNPNVRKGMRETQEPSGETSSSWSGMQNVAGESQWVGSQGYQGQYVKGEGVSTDEYESDDSRTWSDSLHQYRAGRATSTSSNSTSGGSYDPHQTQQRPYDQSGFQHEFTAGHRSESPGQFESTFGPAGSQTSQLARGFARSGTKGSIDTNVRSTSGLGVNEEEGEVTPINRVQSGPIQGSNVMGPPQTTPTRYRDAGMNFGPAHSDLLAGIVPPVRQGSGSERPQPPRLLTGAKMPRPQDAQNQEQLGSSRPLFSAQLDLSGWLEEPVIPSPLYRMGPSLSALHPGPGHSMFPPTPTNSGATAEALRNALAAANLPLPPSLISQVGNSSSSDTVMDQNNPSHNADASTSEEEVKSNESQVAAKQWWAHTSGGNANDVDVQGVAQACAGHFTLYPALMVLPDPTSPVPPLFHRPWLAHSRLNTPASLARARVLLAGYHVKLPSSEGMVWEMIAMETNNLIGSFDRHIHASDQEVYSTTAALWFLIILLLMSSDPTSATSVPDSLVDSSLIGLSQYSRLLSQRLKDCEERRKVKSSPTSFIDWGFEETMKRTLFASYSLLVLQRFRETSTEIQSQLAGIELILDIPLPATALEFEAGTELEWRACQHVQITEASANDLSNTITTRDLLNARKEGETEENRKKVTQYFDRHDDFTNICLSVAFALDRNIIT